MHKERLLKIVDHLKNGKLGHANFDFSTVNSNVVNGHWESVTDTEHPCGTNGCAVGEFPFIFPEDWTFKSMRSGKIAPCPVNKSFPSLYWEHVETYLNLNELEISMLFVPTSSRYYPGMKVLDNKVTKEEVADNILAFIAFKEVNVEKLRNY